MAWLCHDRSMDLEAARKALARRTTFSSKRVAFFAVVGLCVLGGILLRAGLYSFQPEAEQNSPATSSSTPAAGTPAVEMTKSVVQEGGQNAPAAATPSPLPAIDTSAVEKGAAVPSSPPAQNAVATPTEQAEPAVNEPTPASEPDENAESALPDSGIILVARLPVEVRASPSSSAPTLYGFPAGRPFRVIGHEGGFAHIQDLKSSASGWIDEAALAQPPIAPETSAPAQPKPFSVGRTPTNPSASAGQKPKTTQKDSAVTADSEVATQPDRRRPGLFGRGGLFGGIFGN